jgi:hypothetical protein
MYYARVEHCGAEDCIYNKNTVCLKQTIHLVMTSFNVGPEEIRYVVPTCNSYDDSQGE